MRKIRTGHIDIDGDLIRSHAIYSAAFKSAFVFLAHGFYLELAIEVINFVELVFRFDLVIAAVFPGDLGDWPEVSL